MKILNILVSFFVMFLFGCNKDEQIKYIPLSASSQGENMYFTIEDENGNDLVNEVFPSSIEARNEYSNLQKYSASKRYNVFEKNIVSFGLPLPDIRLLGDYYEKIEDDKNESTLFTYYVETNNFLHLDGTKIKIKAKFRYSEKIFPKEKGLVFGNSSLRITEIQIDDEIFKYDKDGYLIIPLVYKNGNFFLK